MLKFYLSSSSDTPKYLTYINTIAMLNLPNKKKKLVAEVVYFLGACARNPTNLAIHVFHHIFVYNSAIVEAIHSP